MVSGGTFAYGGYPDIDGLFREQATELDRKQARGHPASDPAARPRAGHGRADLQLAFLTASGRAWKSPALGLIAGYAFSAPYEDVKLKAK